MSSAHLTTGSQRPDKVPGKLRLYSMEYCPYAQRARLVLQAKGVPYDVVNINLINKPEWITEVHPEGKVPALDTGDKIIVESLDIANYLDGQYDSPPLYPAEPQARAEDEALIKKIEPLTHVFYQVLFAKDKRPAAEWLQEFIPHLEIFEEALEKRQSLYFGGDKPGMVDFMLWPWAERAGTIAISLGERLPLDAKQFPLLRAWRKLLRTHPAVEAVYHGPEKFHKVLLFKTAGLPPDYDSL